MLLVRENKKIIFKILTFTSVSSWTRVLITVLFNTFQLSVTIVHRVKSKFTLAESVVSIFSYTVSILHVQTFAPQARISIRPLN